MRDANALPGGVAALHGKEPDVRASNGGRRRSGRRWSLGEHHQVGGEVWSVERGRWDAKKTGRDVVDELTVNNRRWEPGFVTLTRDYAAAISLRKLGR